MAENALPSSATSDTSALQPSTISDAANAALASLLSDLKAAGNADGAALQAFANKYAGIVATWSLNLANAKLSNNTSAVSEYSQDLEQIAAIGVAEAAVDALKIQSAVEANAAALFETILGIAAKAAVASLVAI